MGISSSSVAVDVEAAKERPRPVDSGCTTRMVDRAPHSSRVPVVAALTGHSPAGFSCLDRSGTAGDTAALTRSLRKTFGRIESDRSGTSLVIDAESARRAWAYAHYAVANAGEYGVTAVTVAGRRWQTQDMTLPEWTQGATPGDDPRRVEITVR